MGVLLSGSLMLEYKVIRGVLLYNIMLLSGSLFAFALLLLCFALQKAGLQREGDLNEAVEEP